MSEANTIKPKLHWPSLIQAVLTAIALLISVAVTALTFVGGVIRLFQSTTDPYEVPTVLSVFVAGVLITGLLGAAMYFTVMRLIDQKAEPGDWWPRLRKLLHPKHLLVGYIFVLPLGYFANQQDIWRNILIPVLNIYALAVPVVVFVWLALRGLPKGSYQLGWGSFSLGLAIGPTVVMFLELVAFVILVIAAAIFMSSNQALADAFEMASQMGLGNNDPYQVSLLLRELFNTPGFLVLVLLFVSGFVPLIEELFKPISVWVLLGRNLRPVDGWVIGALSGAGFALFENIGNATLDAAWLSNVLQRAAASIPHVFTAALMGYTLALAHSQRKYGKVLVTYLGVVLIHAAWNAGGVLTAAASLTSPHGLVDESWTPIFLAVMGALLVGMVIALLRINRRLFQEAQEIDAVDAADIEKPDQDQKQLV